MKKLILTLLLVNIFQAVSGQGSGKPILDMHLHAFYNDSTELTQYEKNTFEAIEQFNLIAITSANQHSKVVKWQKILPDRIIPGLSFFNPQNLDLDSLKQWHNEGTLQVLGEIGIQYTGIKPNDSIMYPIWEFAEILEIPVAFHMGPGPDGAAYGFAPPYRAANSNPLLLEEVLVKYPKLKVYVMHAGWPFISEMIALLQAHPQVYVDIGVINWDIPEKEFYYYLNRLVDAGFGKRIMYGSDQVSHPEMIEVAINRVSSANFLTEEEKRDIFYNNAARFLELNDEQISKHHEN